MIFQAGPCKLLRCRIFPKQAGEAVFVGKLARCNDGVAENDRIGILLRLYLEADFSEKHLALVAKIRSEEYYVNMMIAWYFATALAKQWDAAIPYLEKKKLSDWVHKKTIQKAVESYRITKEQKEYLRTMKKMVY